MKERLLNLLDCYSLAAIVETKEGNFYEGVSLKNSYGEEMINAISFVILTAIMKKENISAVYFMSKEKNYVLPITAKEIIIELVPKDVLFNRIDIDGEMKVYTYYSILKEN